MANLRPALVRSTANRGVIFGSQREILILLSVEKVLFYLLRRGGARYPLARASTRRSDARTHAWTLLK